MVGNPTTLQKARQDGWNSNHLPFCLLCGCLIKKIKTLKIHVQTHSGEWPSGCEQCNFTCTTAGHLNKRILIHSGEKLFEVFHYQSQHSTQISPVIWRETSGSKLEKQILATKSHSSNDLIWSVVLLLQVIFFSILFNVCDISELVSFNYHPQPCFFVFDNPTLAINIIHCGMNRLPFLLHLVKDNQRYFFHTISPWLVWWLSLL